MSDDETSGEKSGKDPRSASERAGSFNWIAAVLLAFVGYQIYSGVYLKEIGIPPFVIKFDTGPSDSGEPVKVTQDFIVGKWRVEIENAQNAVGTLIDYYPDGNFSGSASQFQGIQGQRNQVSGTWTTEVLSDKIFRLNLQYENGETWQGVFEALSPNRIHNTAENYIAVRDGG